MPLLPLFRWSRKKTILSTRAYQQDPVLRVAFWTTTGYLLLPAMQQAWIAQGFQRDWTVRLWYARGVYDGKSLPSLSILAEALGASDAEGAEVVANDYILARLSGVGGYAGIGTAPLVVSSDEVPTNSYFDIDFRIAIPDGAATLGTFALRLGFSSEAESYYFGGDFYQGLGTMFGGVDPTVRTLLDRSKCILTGSVHTAAQKASIEASGLTFPSDSPI